MSPTTGSLNFSPWYALIIRTSQRITSTIQSSGVIIPMTGKKLMMTMMIHNAMNVMIDCIAWNLTVLFSFSTRKKRMPVRNPSRYVKADAMFSSRPNVAFTIFFTP